LESADDESAPTEKMQESFVLGREGGIREGRRQEQAAQEARVAEHENELNRRYMAQAAKLAKQFTQKQEHLLEGVEQEIVQLALAIAECVLRREALTDPLLLVGAVRIALGQLAKTTHVRLRLPVADVELWSETMSHIPNLKVRPEIVPDQAMQAGECSIESEMGSVDLGIAAQLDMIRGSLLDDRPGPYRERECRAEGERLRT
jgi:flagellar assembly protein FliH